MAEFLNEQEADSRYGSKGKANAGLTLGIIGTALGGLAVAGRHVIGNGNASGNFSCDDRFVGKDLFWQQNVALEKEFGQARYDNLKQNYDLYVTLDNKITNVACKQAQLETALPLMFELDKVNSERYTDKKIAHVDKQMAIGALAVEAQLSQKIDGVMGLPWSSIITGIPKMPRCTVDVTCPTSAS